MLPANAPSVVIDADADTVTLTGTLSWQFLFDEDGDPDPTNHIAQRTTTGFAVRIPFRGSPFDPAFRPPDLDLGTIEVGPGRSATGIDDLKHGFEQYDGSNNRDWAFFHGTIYPGLDPHGILLERYTVSDAGLGRLDASQTYQAGITFNDDFTRITAVGAEKFDEYVLFGFDAVLSETWFGLTEVDGRGAAMSDYRDINGVLTDGNDRLSYAGQSQDRRGYGLEGDDTLTGGAGDDTLSGGAGSDRVTGNDGDDSLTGGPGRDRLTGGGGNDTLEGGDGNDKIKAGGGDDFVTGDAGNDKIKGGDGNDTLNAGDGRDRVNGNGGDDLIIGGAEPNRLQGGSGDDELYASRGDDTLQGGRGADTLDGESGDDTLVGNDGGDAFRFDNDWGRDVVRDLEAADTVRIEGEVSGTREFRDALTERRGDTIYDDGNDGANVIVFEGMTIDEVMSATLSFG